MAPRPGRSRVAPLVVVALFALVSLLQIQHRSDNLISVRIVIRGESDGQLAGSRWKNGVSGDKALPDDDAAWEAVRLPTDCPAQLPQFRTGRFPPPPLVTVPQALRYEQVANETVEYRESIDCRLPPPIQPVHVLYTVDARDFPAALASMRSALESAADPGRLRFHVAVPHGARVHELCQRLQRGLRLAVPHHVCPAPWVRDWRREAAAGGYEGSKIGPSGSFLDRVVRAVFPGKRGAEEQRPRQQQPAPSLLDVPHYSPATLPPCWPRPPHGQNYDDCRCGSLQFHFIAFDAARRLPYALGSAGAGHAKDRAELETPINFARNVADDLLLPWGVRRLVYLDADTIVQSDLGVLADDPLAEGDGSVQRHRAGGVEGDRAGGETAADAKQRLTGIHDTGGLFALGPEARAEASSGAAAGRRSLLAEAGSEAAGATAAASMKQAATSQTSTNQTSTNQTSANQTSSHTASLDATTRPASSWTDPATSSPSPPASPSQLVGAMALSCRMKMYQLFVFSEPEVWEGLDPEGCYANAGVFAVDLERYKQLNVSGRIADLVQVHGGGRRLWTQGVQQPSFVLAFLPHARILPRSWNVDALGYSPDKPRVPRCALESGHVLHWNGAHKPWRCGKGGGGEGAARGRASQHDCYASYWRPFAVEDPTEPSPEP